jgi:hypothetical protein
VTGHCAHYSAHELLLKTTAAGGHRHVLSRLGSRASSSFAQPDHFSPARNDGPIGPLGHAGHFDTPMFSRIGTCHAANRDSIGLVLPQPEQGTRRLK